MNIPEAMSHTSRETHRNAPPTPRFLLLVLSTLVILGIAGTTASIITAQQQSSTARRDVLNNQRLLEQVRSLEQMNTVEVEQHRARNEALHADICRLILDVVKASTLDQTAIRPCAPPLLHTTGK